MFGILHANWNPAGLTETSMFNANVGVEYLNPPNPKNACIC